MNQDSFLKLDKLSKNLEDRLYGKSKSWVILLSTEYKELLTTNQFQQFYKKQFEVNNVISFIGLNGDSYKFVLLDGEAIDVIGVYLEQ